MKFSSALQFNAVPEWRENYIDYDRLKRLVYRNDDGDTEPSDFVKTVETECKKVNDFFEVTEQSVCQNVDSLLQRVSSYLPDSYSDDNASSESSDDEDREPAQRHRGVDFRRLQPLETVKIRREVAHAYVVLSELIGFCQVNREGVRKAYKKYDKVHGTRILGDQMRDITKFDVFSADAKRHLGSRVDSLVSSYARLTNETEDEAGKALSSMLREHVVYERNTVWRDLMRLERQPDQGNTAAPQAAPSKRVQFLVAISLGLLILFLQPLSDVQQSRCLAIVVMSSVLWATEALPLFITALLIPFLCVVLRVFQDENGDPLPATAASALVFASMWSQVVQVLIGGFALAAALSKHGIAKAVAQRVLAQCGKHGPRATLLVFMLLSAFLCMWISNVASPVLLYSVAQPLLRTLPYNDPFSRALVLGIALASNIGGTTSPIASPQNLIALQNMDPPLDWLQWFFVTLPVALASITGVWLWLCLVSPITANARQSVLRVANGHSAVEKFGLMHYYVLFTTVLTIVIWCFAKPLEPYTGSMGVLAFVPLVLLFGPGCLTATDFNNFMWTIVALAMGGVVLGKAVDSCGLLANAASKVEHAVSGFPFFIIVLIFGLVVIVIASFISHTVAALIVLPLVKSVGDQLSTPHPSLLVMLSAILCSMAMALPTSGFPNVTAVCLTDEMGRQYVGALDFIKNGVPASLISYLVVISLGFTLCMVLKM